MSKHSPTPWHANGSKVESTYRVADCNGDSNAQHIVHCVNHHDELVKALEFLADCATSPSDGDEPKKPGREALRYARAILAKVKGE